MECHENADMIPNKAYFYWLLRFCCWDYSKQAVPGVDIYKHYAINSQEGPGFYMISGL